MQSMHRPTITLTFRNAIMIALGLTASTFAGAGGCADRGGHAVCADTEIDYATCGYASVENAGPDDPPVHIQVVCFDGSDGCDPCDAETITSAAIEQAENSCTVEEIQRVTLLCGPDPDPVPDPTDCCYKVQLEGVLSCGVEGRPLFVGAELAPRVAALQDGRAWLAGVEELEAICRPQDPDTIELLRSHWLESARYEHASVAAFARVSLQLLALGAPPHLVRATQQAKVDEVRHAQLCFGLAAAYGGAAPSEAGPLRIDGCVATRMDLESVLREAIFEGALGEGAAAMEALEGARSCGDPAVRELLLQIGADEQRHALLAYQTVQWALDAYPERARAIVLECLREGHLQVAPPAAELGDDDGLPGYGLLSSSRRAWIRHESWSGVVAPILGSVLAVARHARATALT